MNRSSKVIAALAVSAMAAMFCMCTGLIVPLDLAFATVFGWFRFLKRVIPEIEVSGPGVVLFVGLIVLAVVAVQFAGAKLLPVVARSGPLPSPRWRTAWTFSLVAAVVLLFVGGISLVGMAHQAYWLATAPVPLTTSDWQPALRAHSRNNLNMISLAEHNAHDVDGRFPVGGLFGPSGQALHGWQSLLLPYVDQNPLFLRIDLDRPWNDPSQREIFQTVVPTYVRPARFERRAEAPDGYGPSTYSANGHAFGANRSVRLEEIPDGAATTILQGEIQAQVPAWASPTNWRDPALGINASDDGFGSPFTGGAHFSFGDGSVRFLSDDIDPAVLKALATPAGGEPLVEF